MEQRQRDGWATASRRAVRVGVVSCLALTILLGIAPASTGLADGDTDPPVAENADDERPSARLIAPRDAESRAARIRSERVSSAVLGRIEDGLDWLARHQRADGGWDADAFHEHCAEGDRCTGIGKGQHGEDMPCPFDGPISALATLAFLANGHRPGLEGDPHAEVVERAERYLLGVSDRWGLPLATVALAELEVMAPHERRRARVESHVEQLVGIRQEDGAWGYAAPWRPGSDVPYSALVVQALVAARDAGVELPENLGDEVHAYLDSLERDDGKLAYLLDGRRYGYTPTTSNAHCAAAMRCLVEAGTDGKAHREHLGVLAKRRPKWKISFKTVKVPGRGEVPVQIGHLSMYQWWYGTLAAYQEGGATWSSWWRKLVGALAQGQADSGCARGSWEPDGTYERQTGGRVFATALGVLMLSEPLRHRRLEETR